MVRISTIAVTALAALALAGAATTAGSLKINPPQAPATSKSYTQ